jgi:hypothetical protein
MAYPDMTACQRPEATQQSDPSGRSSATCGLSQPYERRRLTSQEIGECGWVTVVRVPNFHAFRQQWSIFHRRSEGVLRASGRASPLFPDEAPEAFGHNQHGRAKLDDLDITAGDKQIERAAVDLRMAR